MILPWLNGFVPIKKAPFVYALIAINCIVFFLFNQGGFRTHRQFDDQFLVTTGRIYQHWIGKSPMQSTAELRALGSSALRDPAFLELANAPKKLGDPVVFREWQKTLNLYKSERSSRQSQILGLLGNEFRPLTFLTYQFVHANFIHLASNMILLALFGSALEVLIGELGMLVLFIGGGCIGAVLFLLSTKMSTTPMVGASGAISALMAFYATYGRNPVTRFFYFVAPVKGFYGIIWLPSWLIFPLSFIADISAYFLTPADAINSIATTAHLGGMVFGITSALALRALHFFSGSESSAQ